MVKNITSDPSILSGKPVISGTRIPVDRLIYLLKDGYTPESIRNEYPQLSLKKINSVIDEIAQNYAAQVA